MNKKSFIYFDSKQKKIQLGFICMKLTAGMSTIWSAVLYLMFVYFFSLCKIKYFGTLVNISFNMFWFFFFFYNLHFLKALRTWCISYYHIRNHKIVYWNQALAYEACDHMPETLRDVLQKNMPCLIKKASRCAADCTSKTTTFFIFHFL